MKDEPGSRVESSGSMMKGEGMTSFKAAHRAMLLILLGATSTVAQVERVIPFPPDDRVLEWLEAKEKAQMGTLDSFDVLHDFGFTDEQAASGITFRHRPPGDALKYYKPVPTRMSVG